MRKPMGPNRFVDEVSLCFTHINPVKIFFVFNVANVHFNGTQLFLII